MARSNTISPGRSTSGMCHCALRKRRTAYMREAFRADPRISAHVEHNTVCGQQIRQGIVELFVQRARQIHVPFRTALYKLRGAKLRGASVAFFRCRFMGVLLADRRIRIRCQRTVGHHDDGRLVVCVGDVAESTPAPMRSRSPPTILRESSSMQSVRSSPCR